MISKENAVAAVKREAPERKITEVKPYKDGFLVNAVDPKAKGTDFSGTVFRVDSKGGITKLSVIDMMTL